MKRFAGPTPTLTTARLVLRPMALSDAPAVQKQFERFEVVRYLNCSVPWPYPDDGAQFFLEWIQGPVVRAGREQAWAITLDGQFIGSITLTTEGDENRGFWLTPEYWGQGYMREAADRITDYALNELGGPDLVTGNAVENQASSRLKKSQGFTLEATFPKQFVGGWMDYEQWKIRRPDWNPTRKIAR